MANILLKYFQEKFDKSVKSLEGPGPVVTISREFGCSGKRVAGRICEILNTKDKDGKPKPEWKCINKEIIEESAKELDLHPSMIKQSISTKQKSMIDDILSSFLESNYKADLKIKKTIAEVVDSFASEGHNIIIGRGGVALTQHYSNALHIKLFASFEWRLEKIISKYHYTPEEAKKIIIDTDKKRQAMIDHFHKKKDDNTIFDLMINAESYSVKAIAEIIIKAMELKKIV